MLKAPRNKYDNRVGRNQFYISNLFVGQSIDNSCSYYDEKIGHFANRNLAGAVTKNAENGKQPQGKSDL